MFAYFLDGTTLFLNAVFRNGCRLAKLLKRESNRSVAAAAVAVAVAVTVAAAVAVAAVVVAVVEGAAAF